MLLVLEQGSDCVGCSNAARTVDGIAMVDPIMTHLGLAWQDDGVQKLMQTLQDSASRRTSWLEHAAAGGSAARAGCCCCLHLVRTFNLPSLHACSGSLGPGCQSFCSCRQHGGEQVQHAGRQQEEQASLHPATVSLMC